MRWSKKIARGMNLIYSLASVESTNGEWSVIACRKQTQPDPDNADCFISADPCGRCEQCLNNQALSDAIAYLGQMIDKHARSQPGTTLTAIHREQDEYRI